VELKLWTDLPLHKPHKRTELIHACKVTSEAVAVAACPCPRQSVRVTPHVVYCHHIYSSDRKIGYMYAKRGFTSTCSNRLQFKVMAGWKRYATRYEGCETIRSAVFTHANFH
jgi:hypothetical protein